MLFLDIPFVVSVLKNNDCSCETLRKKLITSLDTMGISPIHLHGVAHHS